VVFPEGERRTVAAADEGVVDVLLPLAEDSATWRVRRLRFELLGDVGNRRVLPADGPPLAAGAELVLDPDRPVVVRVPPATVRALRVVDSLRLLVRAEVATELSGHLAVEATGAGGDVGPGDPVPDAELVATTVEVGSAAAWVTLPLRRPATPDPEAGLWAVVQAARGRVVMPLATPGAEAEVALVRRLGANGRYRPLPSVAGVHTSAVPLRVGGEPPPTAPIPALVLVVPGTAVEPLRVTPGAAAQAFELTFEPPVTAAAADSALSGDHLVVRLTVVGPGDHTIGPVVVGYEGGP
jgi:hypothetical protein